MARLQVTPGISVDEAELEERFYRAGGPGGQNVNKVETAVQLRFDARRSPSLPNEVSVRLQKLAGARLTAKGVVVISAQRFRTQERNRADARDRLIELIARAAAPPFRDAPPGPPAPARNGDWPARRRAARSKRLRGKPVDET